MVSPARPEISTTTAYVSDAPAVGARGGAEFSVTMRRDMDDNVMTVAGWATRRRLRPKAGRCPAAPRALSAQGPQPGLRRDSLLRLRRAVRPDHRRPPPPRGRRLAPARQSQRGAATDQRAGRRRPGPRHQPDRDCAEQQPIATARRPPVKRGRPVDRPVPVSESEGLVAVSRCAVFRRTVMA